MAASSVAAASKAGVMTETVGVTVGITERAGRNFAYEANLSQ